MRTQYAVLRTSPHMRGPDRQSPSPVPACHLRSRLFRGEVPRWGWEQRCQGPGAKGLRTHAWAWVALDPAGCPDGWARSLLIRRTPSAEPDAESDGDEQYAYFLCYHRRGTTLTELIGVAGRRWGIEEAFAVTKSEAGLDEHQV